MSPNKDNKNNKFTPFVQYSNQPAKYLANQPENKSGGLLSDIAVKSFYRIPISQKKKDSGLAVLVQVQSLEQVTNYPNYIGLVQYFQSSAGGWDLKLELHML